MATSGIYKIRNTRNEHFYLGSSDDIDRRWNEGHKAKLVRGVHDNPHLQNAWNKYGETAFVIEVVKVCPKVDLLTEEQKELDLWVGKSECYNIRKSATCPVAPGSVRPQWVREKISATQKGVARWTEEQKRKMSVDRMGKTHSAETKKKMVGRETSFQNIQKAQQANLGRIYSSEHKSAISLGKMNMHKKLSDEERQKIKDGVRKSCENGHCRKNKIPKEEYSTIRSLYFSGTINKRQLAFRYGVHPASMNKLLQRIERQ